MVCHFCSQYMKLYCCYSSMFCSKTSLVYSLSDEIGYQCLLYNQAAIQGWKCTTYFSISLLGVSQRGTRWLSVTVLTVPQSFLGFCWSTHLPSPWAQKLLQCSLVPVVPICTVPHCETEVCIFRLSLLYLPCLTELSCCSQHTHFQIHFKLCPFVFLFTLCSSHLQGHFGIFAI